MATQHKQGVSLHRQVSHASINVGMGMVVLEVNRHNPPPLRASFREQDAEQLGTGLELTLMRPIPISCSYLSHPLPCLALGAGRAPYNTAQEVLDGEMV